MKHFIIGLVSIISLYVSVLLIVLSIECKHESAYVKALCIFAYIIGMLLAIASIIVPFYIYISR